MSEIRNKDGTYTCSQCRERYATETCKRCGKRLCYGCYANGDRICLECEEEQLNEQELVNESK